MKSLADLIPKPPPERSAIRWIGHRDDRPLPPPIVDHDDGDEHPRCTVRVYSTFFHESWLCRICDMINADREQLFGKTRGRCCYYCNTERPEYPARSR